MAVSDRPDRVATRRRRRWPTTVTTAGILLLVRCSSVVTFTFAFSSSICTPKLQTRYTMFMQKSSWITEGRQTLLWGIPSNEEDGEVGTETPTPKVLEEVDIPAKETSFEITSEALRKKRQMTLAWCGREICTTSRIREKIVGDRNHMEFEGPATGQVIYTWDDEDNSANQQSPLDVSTSSVLLLVKHHDDELIGIAAEAVRQLTDLGIQVLLHPELAAKFKHYFGVDDENMIKLFEPRPVPGFGGNHVAATDGWGMGYNLNVHDEEFESQSHRHNKNDNGPDPDLICTLGGDGLLILGFLTPFSKDEMVGAIQRSLGLVKDQCNDMQSSGSDPNHSFPSSSASTTQIRPSMGGPEGNRILNDQDLDSPPKVNFGAYNRICLSMRMRLDCRVINREGVVRARFNVLNEVVIDRGSSPYLANLECFCDDVHLTTVQADGVIFSTPTGSTAYSMSAGGSVVHPAVPAILVTPICPHVLSFRSMVFPDHVVLRCYVPEDARSDACVAFDGKYRRELHRGDSVQIQMSSYPVPTINRADHSDDWLSSLKRNFNFNTRVRQGPL
eukprot:scaffold18524_cov56-Attheya_sp.AAC.2